MPLEGMDRNEYLNTKFGGKEKASKVYKKIEDEGKLVNIHFQFKKIKKNRLQNFILLLLAKCES